jgi:hypothetical protein
MGCEIYAVADTSSENCIIKRDISVNRKYAYIFSSCCRASYTGENISIDPSPELAEVEKGISSQYLVQIGFC